MNIMHNEKLSRFELVEDDLTSVVEYQDVANVWHITHTFVPERQRGQGTAAVLVRHALEVARSLGKKVVPVCPYVVVYLKRHPEFKDLL